MKLKNLLDRVEVIKLNALQNLEISGISIDSRSVLPGDAFLAVPGFQTDGHKYIPSALDKGAILIICEKPPEREIPFVLVKDARRAMAPLADNFYDHPSQSMKLIGVTGTKGKTTTTFLIKQIIEQAKSAKVGLIGTNQNMIGQDIIPADRTTPDALSLQRLFAQMRDEGCKYCVMEVSSHALEQGRVDKVRFAVGAFTNLSHDHLDYHRTMEAYRDAKALLFDACEVGAFNTDDINGRDIYEHAPCRRVSFGLGPDVDLRAQEISLESDHVSFLLKENGGEPVLVQLNIPGSFSVYNALAAIACCRELGISKASIVNELKYAHGVKGRMEVVPVPAPFTVLIDYAHVPDAMEQVLQSVRGFAKGRIIMLFGAGGNRDVTKRPEMGEVAARLSDVAVVTTDNPRTEAPGKIIADIQSGMSRSSAQIVVIEDRRTAIAWTLENAHTNDIVILAGKGHETYQEINGIKHHFDEREIIAAFFASK